MTDRIEFVMQLYSVPDRAKHEDFYSLASHETMPHMLDHLPIDKQFKLPNTYSSWKFRTHPKVKYPNFGVADNYGFFPSEKTDGLYPDFSYVVSVASAIGYADIGIKTPNMDVCFAMGILFDNGDPQDYPQVEDVEGTKKIEYNADYIGAKVFPGNSRSSLYQLITSDTSSNMLIPAITVLWQ